MWAKIKTIFIFEPCIQKKKLFENKRKKIVTNFFEHVMQNTLEFHFMTKYRHNVVQVVSIN